MPMTPEERRKKKTEAERRRREKLRNQLTPEEIQVQKDKLAQRKRELREETRNAMTPSEIKKTTQEESLKRHERKEKQKETMTEVELLAYHATQLEYQKKHRENNPKNKTKTKKQNQSQKQDQSQKQKKNKSQKQDQSKKQNQSQKQDQSQQVKEPNTKVNKIVDLTATSERETRATRNAKEKSIQVEITNTNSKCTIRFHSSNQSAEQTVKPVITVNETSQTISTTTETTIENNLTTNTSALPSQPSNQLKRKRKESAGIKIDNSMSKKFKSKSESTSLSSSASEPTFLSAFDINPKPVNVLQEKEPAVSLVSLSMFAESAKQTTTTDIQINSITTVSTPSTTISTSTIPALDTSSIDHLKNNFDDNMNELFLEDRIDFSTLSMSLFHYCALENNLENLNDFEGHHSYFDNDF